MTGIARVLHTQQNHYFRKRINFNDAGISGGVVMGTFPKGAEIIDAVCNIRVAFNAGTTNVITVGTVGAAYNNIMAAADITEGTPGSYRAPILALGVTSALMDTADTDCVVMYAQTGTAATTGQADIIVEYVPNNDQ